MQDNIKNYYWVLDFLKTASKKVVQKTGDFLENKIQDAVPNLYDDKIVKTKPTEEIIIPPEKKKKLRQVLQKVTL